MATPPRLAPVSTSARLALNRLLTVYPNTSAPPPVVMSSVAVSEVLALLRVGASFTPVRVMVCAAVTVRLPPVPWGLKLRSGSVSPSASVHVSPTVVVASFASVCSVLL